MARCRTLPELPGGDEVENQARQKSLTVLFQELAGMLPGLPEELQVAVFNAGTPGRFADLLADALNFSYAEKLLLLFHTDVRARLEALAVFMNRELEVLKLGMKIQNEVHQAMSQSQREFFLREQLRSIQQELGEDTRNPDIIEIERRLGELTLPERVTEVVKKELSRLELIPQAAPEYHISYTYINWLLDVPWLTCTDDRLDCNEAARVLDADHYGLKDVKERILEFLAVLQLHGGGERRSPILCLVGPPGVGKTSLGQSIARAMNRNFVRVSLGGIRDEARIQRYLDLGADRCILGTAAVKNFDFTAEMAQKYGAQIAVGVDMKDGAVAVNGWKEVTPEPGVAFCRRCANAGVKAIIATDISRDGTMQGTNMALYRELLTIPGIEVTASGGIAAMAELAELSAMHCHAAILGKSIYTGAIDLAEAVRLYEGE